MLKLAIAIVCVALFACGGQEPAGTEATPSVETAAPAAGTPAPEIPAAVEEAVGKAVDPAVASCLDLVRGAQFAEAVPVCMRAVQADPQNAEVKSALETAQARLAEGQAGQAAAGAAEAAASGQAELEKAKQGIPGGQP